MTKQREPSGSFYFGGSFSQEMNRFSLFARSLKNSHLKSPGFFFIFFPKRLDSSFVI